MVTVREHLAFTLALHRALASDVHETVCWSPLSVACAVAVLAQSAQGSTRDELVQLLLDDSQGNLAAQADLLVAATRLDDRAQIAVANTLWADETVPMRAGFESLLQAWPGGQVRTAPFSKAPDVARTMINADVATTTNGLIPELLLPGTVSADTIVALVNALYLRVSWNHGFPEKSTAPAIFYSPTGEQLLDTMTATRNLGYARQRGWQIVTLGAGEVEAVVMLPDEELAAVESSLDAVTLVELLAAPKQTPVQLSMPRLKVSTRATLTELLQQLGVNTVFTVDPDLGLISPEPLVVSEVIHEAVLQVDEAGIEGAAATVVMMTRGASFVSPESVIVRVDRPFLFLVRHRDTGMVYFLARVTQPV